MKKGDKIGVLLVEDVNGDAQAITRAICYGDDDAIYSVTLVQRLKEGLRILSNSENKIDIILLDLSLPDAKDIKGLVEINVLYPEVPIIIISDQTDERVIRRAMLNGANRFLSKNEASGMLIKKIIADTISAAKDCQVKL